MSLALDACALDALDNKVVFGQVMGELADKDELLTVVVSDYGRRLSLDRFRELRPEGYVQCGIAEQNQLEVAAALALEGYHVVVPTYACFLSTRALDQIRVLVGSMGAPVVLVGLSGGYGSSVLGTSHMALSDIAWLRQVPGLEILTPATNTELAAMLRERAANPRPTYIRITHPLPQAPFHLSEAAAQAQPFTPQRLTLADKPMSLQASATTNAATPAAPTDLWCEAAPAQSEPPAADVSFLAAGSCVGIAAHVTQLLAQEGLTANIYNLRTVAPLDARVVEEACASKLVVTLEEHFSHGGVGAAVAELLCERTQHPRLLRLGAAFEELPADDPAKLLEQSGLTPSAVYAGVCNALIGSR